MISYPGRHVRAVIRSLRKRNHKDITKSSVKRYVVHDLLTAFGKCDLKVMDQAGIDATALVFEGKHIFRDSVFVDLAAICRELTEHLSLRFYIDQTTMKLKYVTSIPGSVMEKTDKVQVIDQLESNWAIVAGALENIENGSSRDDVLFLIRTGLSEEKQMKT